MIQSWLIVHRILIFSKCNDVTRYSRKFSEDQMQKFCTLNSSINETKLCLKSTLGPIPLEYDDQSVKVIGRRLHISHGLAALILVTRRFYMDD